ncbi:unnamed protein product [Soboliphyme baturini]|uniref:Peptidase_M14 domain-containing protein n=1 Tax=Soboliphyme baturini TaxID=241478 RepID=A0A183J7W1_9BILA|nr:unnamed protein product [Soboliphyme baturini]
MPLFWPVIQQLLNQKVVKSSLSVMKNICQEYIDFCCLFFQPVGKELLLRFLTFVLQSYGVDPLVTRLLDQTRVHLFPLANPDGFAVASHGACDVSYGRNNANGVQISTNFPGIWQFDMGKLQPETKAIIKWVDSLSISLMLSFYGGSMVVSYPFDHVTDGTAPKYSATPDDDVFRQVARAYSKAHRRLVNGSFCPNSLDFYPSGIINGAERSMQDFLYFTKGVVAIRAHISCCRYPYRVTLRKFWKENKQPMLEFWNQSQQGKLVFSGGNGELL